MWQKQANNNNHATESSTKPNVQNVYVIFIVCQWNAKTNQPFTETKTHHSLQNLDYGIELDKDRKRKKEEEKDVNKR